MRGQQGLSIGAHATRTGYDNSRSPKLPCIHCNSLVKGFNAITLAVRLLSKGPPGRIHGHDSMSFDISNGGDVGIPHYPVVGAAKGGGKDHPRRKLYP